MQFDKFLSNIFFINVTIRECNFAMGTILRKGFAQALVHTSQHLCLCKILSQDCPHGEIKQSVLRLKIEMKTKITNNVKTFQQQTKTSENGRPLSYVETEVCNFFSFMQKLLSAKLFFISNFFLNWFEIHYGLRLAPQQKTLIYWNLFEKVVQAPV